MKKSLFIFLCFATTAKISFCQGKLTFITYKGIQNLAAQKDNLGDFYDEKAGTPGFFIDLYYNSEKVRTKVRQLSENPFTSLMNDLLYTQGTSIMYGLDTKRSIAFEINTFPFAITRTGKIKKILGYQCEEYVAHPAGHEIKYWITDELGVNISPTGNIGIIGTVLQSESSNGLALIATGIKDSVYDKKIFEIPDELSIMNTGKSFSQLQVERVFWKDKTLPAFDLKDIQGNVIKTDNLKGKIIVINFWYIGCKPCSMEMPELNQLVDKYKNNSDVVFLAFALDKGDRITEFLKQREFGYTIIPDAKELTKKMSVNSFPLHLVVDKKGVVQAEIIGYDGKEGQTKNKLSKIIDAVDIK